MKVLFTCGGTAGHINPAVALARLFQARHSDCQVLFVGADGGMETKLVPKEGFPLKTVTITSFRRSFTPAAVGHNVKTLFNMGKSDKQAKAILKEFQPDLVVGTGGYASFPVVKAAAQAGIPTAVHESNVVPGLTTKALSKVADTVMVGFEESRSHYEHPEKVVVTGTPVRPDFFTHTREEARQALGFADDRPLLVSFFGSLGAEVMNAYAAEMLAMAIDDGAPFRWIHGCGRDYGAIMAKLDGKSADGIEAREYIYDMPLVMAAADLVLCRAGASTIAEIMGLCKPSILVPSPNVTADHQTKNAKVLSDAGGAILLPEKEANAGDLYRQAKELLSDRDRRREMGRRLGEMAVHEPLEEIYKVLMGLMAPKGAE